MIAVLFATGLLRATRAGADPSPLLGEVDVVARPAPSGAAPLREPQSATADDLAASLARDVPDFVSRRFAGVALDDVQGTVYQPDLSYRGFTASALPGTPVGLSVWQDGVRVNEPFGDVVLFDLLPENAIAGVALHPGPDPGLGYGTLGGALAVTTKSGVTDPGTRAELSGGSFGRRELAAEHGGARSGFDWFVATRLLDEDGWRDRSPGRLRQAFGKVGWSGERLDVHLTYTFAQNDLHPLGAVPERLLSADRDAVYTHPDRESPALHFLEGQARLALTPAIDLEALVYHRRSTVDWLNGDVGDRCATLVGPARCVDEAGDPVTPAVDHRTGTAARTTGGAVDVARTGRFLGAENSLTAGAAGDVSDTDFLQSDQPAVFDASRGTIPSGPATRTVDATATQDHAGVYVADTVAPVRGVRVTGAARWDRVRVAIDGQPATLRGSHEFDRANPSAGVELDVVDALSGHGHGPVLLRGSYGEGLRVPTVIELACASPDAPCVLPGSSIADPPLRPVVARTADVGVHVTAPGPVEGDLLLHQSGVRDDIVFAAVPGGSVDRGFFANVSRTRRRGVEVSGRGRTHGVEWYASYSHLLATYESHATLASPLGPVQVRPGNRLPGIPEDLVKVGAEAQPVRHVFVGADVEYTSSEPLRGDDANRFHPVDAWVVANAHLRWAVARHVELLALARNLFDARYETSGTLGRDVFAGRSARFLSPAGPIGGWFGVRVTFGPP